MFLKRIDGPRTVTLPSGRKMSRADMPDPGTLRWTAARKAAVVRGVVHGLVSRDWALSAYELSEEELDSWIDARKTHGDAALRVTALQDYRQSGVE